MRYQLVYLRDFFLSLWNGDIDNLVQSSKFPGTYCTNRIQQVKRKLCTLLWPAAAKDEELIEKVCCSFLYYVMPSSIGSSTTGNLFATQQIVWILMNSLLACTTSLNLLVVRMSSLNFAARIDFVNLLDVRIDLVDLQLVRIDFVHPQLVRTTFVHPQLVRTDLVHLQVVRTTFVHLWVVRTIFCASLGCTHHFCASLGCVNHFCASLGCTHGFADLSCVTASTAFTVCAWTKYTPPLLINGNCPSPYLKKGCSARCASSPFSQR